MTLEPGAVYRALLEVQEGADPADVYAVLMGDAVDPNEAIENEIADYIEEAHDFTECREKNLTAGICFGFTCQTMASAYLGPGRIMTDCPCTCHKGDHQ